MKSRSRDERIGKKINKKIDNCRPNKGNLRKYLKNKIKPSTQDRNIHKYKKIKKKMINCNANVHFN
jgi:hypothetical protein